MRDIDDTAPQGHAVYRHLLDEIRAGRLLPGARLRETEIAQRLGLSRTPVREGIRLLEADNMVTHLPRLGATIRQLDHAEVMELYEMRSVLEGTAARLAAQHASELELHELEALNAEFATTSGNPERGSEINRRFHAILKAAARNRFLTRSLNGLQNTLLILGTSNLVEAGRVVEAAAEHGEILAAMRARQPEVAEAAMRRHLLNSQRLRLRRSHPPGSSD